MATPKFQDLTAWQQAEQLMQPAFIRLVDNLRKQLDQSSWKGMYEDVPIWSEGVSAVDKARVSQLQTELKSASAEESIAIEAALAQLPSPHPGYLLHLQQHEQTVTVDLWNLCYKICFQDYDPASGTSHAPESIGGSRGVKIDTTLFDEAGEVDWDQLDRKAHLVVEQTFANLPTS
ncbi:MAG: hypothetical protein KME45_07790 [Stenomitos rutilans HA7619-LM2]|nr:hypothetical protein [Stenomitos rutilans HA7619-LM2]